MLEQLSNTMPQWLVLIVSVFLVILAILWICLPFAIFGIKEFYKKYSGNCEKSTNS